MSYLVYYSETVEKPIEERTPQIWKKRKTVVMQIYA